MNGLLRKVANKLTRRFRVFPISKSIKVAKDFSIGRFRIISISKEASLTISANVTFREFINIQILEDGKLQIGENVFFNNYCSITVFESIQIGANTIIGEGVKLYDHNHQSFYQDGKLMIERNKYNKGPIIIGKSCWIGSNVTILKGVTIGDNVIVGANNLIYKSIPSNTIVKSKTAQTISSAPSLEIS